MDRHVQAERGAREKIRQNVYRQRFGFDKALRTVRGVEKGGELDRRYLRSVLDNKQDRPVVADSSENRENSNFDKSRLNQVISI